jgi:hypothetical protein
MDDQGRARLTAFRGGEFAPWKSLQNKYPKRKRLLFLAVYQYMQEVPVKYMQNIIHPSDRHLILPNRRKMPHTHARTRLPLPI